MENLFDDPARLNRLISRLGLRQETLGDVRPYLNAVRLKKIVEQFLTETDLKELAIACRCETFHFEYLVQDLLDFSDRKIQDAHLIYEVEGCAECVRYLIGQFYSRGLDFTTTHLD